MLHDYIDWPLKHFKITPFAEFIFVITLTVLPGTLLWLLTLGGFRYFNILDKYADRNVERELKESGDWY